jgi:meiotic recombination protein SPO11
MHSWLMPADTRCRLPGARFILVVEKDAVFQRLVEDRLFDELPCVIITGRGMPDIASR